MLNDNFNYVRSLIAFKKYLTTLQLACFQLYPTVNDSSETQDGYQYCHKTDGHKGKKQKQKKRKRVKSGKENRKFTVILSIVPYFPIENQNRN
jgi:hypothetical protein